ncbi:hypothetical protein HAX54_002395 [Datura stramonium]|uniref:Aminoacyl-tRNA synthetase class I anticodon-binding domain-containing protein n=1 Tax=Datura stramonium TaxID=4076 RepID=A0ABS8T4K3_DATST|nr:hypothetical protein [Datura stramonium]
MEVGGRKKMMKLERTACTEGKPILEDGVSEVAKSLLAAYDSGELSGALAEGQPGWKNWVKNFGKLLKRKGKSLFMPLRVLLTGKLHGPDIGATTVLLYNAGTSGSVVPQAGVVTEQWQNSSAGIAAPNWETILTMEQKIAGLSSQVETSQVRERRRDIEYAVRPPQPPKSRPIHQLVHRQYNGLVDELNNDEDEDYVKDDHMENTPPHY